MKIERRSGASLSLPNILRTPAIQALLLQIAGFFIVLLIATLSDRGWGLSLSILGATLLQGMIAAALSWWRGQAFWWWIIHLLFPIFLILALALRLPPTLFLAAFLVFLALYWSTFRTQVPYYPSRLSTWQAVEKLLLDREGLRFIDIGCGFGGLVFYLAHQHPSSRFAGIEIAPLPWLMTKLRARLRRSRAQFFLGDYRALNFADYDVVFAYLSPVAMPDLWEKALAELRPGSLLLSCEFPIVGVPPTETISPREAGPELYVWRL